MSLLLRNLKKGVILILIGVFLSPAYGACSDLFNPDTFLKDPQIKKELPNVSNDNIAKDVFSKTSSQFGLANDSLSFFNAISMGGVYEQEMNLLLKLPTAQWKETFANGWSPYKTQYVEEIIRGNPVKLTSKIAETGGNVITFLSAIAISADIVAGLNGDDAAKLSAVAGTESLVRGYLIGKYGTPGLGLAMIPVGAISYALNAFITARYDEYSNYWWEAYSAYLNKKYPKLAPERDQYGDIPKETKSWIGLTTYEKEAGLKKRLYEFWDDAEINARDYYKAPTIWNKESTLAFSYYRDAFAARYFKSYIYATLKTFYKNEAEKAEVWSRYQAEKKLKELNQLIDVLNGLHEAIKYAETLSTENSLAIIPAEKTLKVGESVVFIVTEKDKSGKETIVTSTALPSNQFIATEPGTYSIEAEYKGKTVTATITVIEQSDPLTAGNIPSTKDKTLELEQLQIQATQLATNICTDGSTAMSNLDAMRASIDAAQGHFYSYEKSIQGAVKTARDLESIEKSLAETHQIAEELAASIGDDSSLAGVRREVVCQAAAGLKSCDSNSERDRLVAEATAAHVDIKPTFERARKNSLELEGLNGQAKEKLEKLTRAQQLTVSVGEIPPELTAAKLSIDQNLSSAETLLTIATESKRPSLTDLATRADGFATELKKELKLPEEGGLRKKADEVLGQISAQTTKADGCLENPRTWLAAEKAYAEEFLNHYSKLEINVNRIKRAFSADGKSPLFSSALEKANLTDFLVSMGDGYIRICAEHLVMAKACMNTVDQLSMVDFSFVMPNIIGMSCQEGKSAVASNQVNFQVVSAGKAPLPDWEYCVDATEPAAGADVALKGETVLIQCFEELDIPAYLATIDCSTLPGATAVYDYGQKVGVCDCVNGVVYNSSQTRCINCEEYHQGMLGAFTAGDLDTAQAWVNESKNCGWVSVAQGQINEERHRQLCARITENMEAACRNNNARAANGFLGEASSQQCSVSPQLYHQVATLVNAYNQRVREQQARQTAQNQRNMQNMLNLIAQGINAATQGNQPNKPSSSSQGYSEDGFGIGYSTGSNNSNSSSSSSGNSSGTSSNSNSKCSKCPDSICIMGVCAKKQ